jgi:hypothetical protein
MMVWFRRCALSAGLVLLSGCGATQALGTAGAAPQSAPYASYDAGSGLYVNEFEGSSILGYGSHNKRNNPPTCHVPSGVNVGDIAVDGKGNLLASNVQTNSVLIFQGPGMCGPKVATIADAYGEEPFRVASNDALSEKFVVTNVRLLPSEPASVSVCTVQRGCTSELTNHNMNDVYSVAMDKNGNCYVTGSDSSDLTTLTYFAKCAGTGVTATGYQNPNEFGALEIDSSGNLVSTSVADSATLVYVYGGCKRACTLVGGPFTLRCCAYSGRLNENSTEFAMLNFATNQIEVYKYSRQAMTYKYSFNNGLLESLEPTGVAYNPRSKQ